jgi:hypothetical protein
MTTAQAQPQFIIPGVSCLSHLSALASASSIQATSQEKLHKLNRRQRASNLRTVLERGNRRRLNNASNIVESASCEKMEREKQLWREVGMLFNKEEMRDEDERMVW